MKNKLQRNWSKKEKKQLEKMYNTSSQEFTNPELDEYRKINYWRGFRACLLLVVVPLLVAFVIFCNSLINL